MKRLQFGLFAMLLSAALSASAETCTWKGGTTTTINKTKYMLASTPANWVDNAVPADGDVVVFDATGAANACRWDLNVKPASWTQTADYANTVTFATTYDDTFPFFEVTGNVDLQGGIWAHLANSALNRTYRLYVKVGGSLTIGANAGIKTGNTGYGDVYVPDGVTLAKSLNWGGTHGGYGYRGHDINAVPYGSITAPEEPGGSSGYSGKAQYPGGGAVRLEVGGALTVQGVISADAVSPYYIGAGGSVWITAGSISGTGSVTADSCSTSGTHADGSGGRVSIVLTGAGATFDAFDPFERCSACSKTTTTAKNAAGGMGTIYVETAADGAGKGRLVLKGTGRTSSSVWCARTPVVSPGETTVAYSEIAVTNGVSALVAAGQTLDLRTTAFLFPSDEAGSIVVAGTLLPDPSRATDYSVTLLGGRIEATEMTVGAGMTLSTSEQDGSVVAANLTVLSGATFVAGKPVEVQGDFRLDGTLTGVLGVPPVALDMTVDGNMTVSETGAVSLDNLGYNGSLTQPADQVRPGGTFSASHGGWGCSAGTPSERNPVQPYGSVYAPYMGGMLSNSHPGGGILRLEVTGVLTNNGAISANAIQPTSAGNAYASAGGAIDIAAASLAGSGSISANATQQQKWNHGVSGGGRVAVRLTDPSADFSEYAGPITAYGSVPPTAAGNSGAPGTVYLQSGAQKRGEGRLLVVYPPDTAHPSLDTPLGGLYMAADENTFGDVLVGPNATLSLLNAMTLHVSGILSNGCKIVCGEGTTVDFIGSGVSRIYGNVDFSNLTCSSAGKTIVVDDGATVTVKGVGGFSGEAESPVTLCSATEGSTWTLKVDGSVQMDGVALRDCQCATPITVVNGTDLGGNSATIEFKSVPAGEVLTWTGATSSSWDEKTNWDRSRTPVKTDRLVIPAGCPNAPALSVSAVCLDLTVAEGAMLSLGANTLTVSGVATVDGALAADEQGCLSVVGSAALAGFAAPLLTVRLSGAGVPSLAANGTSFGALLDEGTSAVLSGAFTVGTFAMGDGTKAVDCRIAAGSTLSASSFVLRGSPAATNATLACVTPGGTWKLNVSQADVAGAAVSGSDASQGVAIVPTDCRDDGDNANWLFVDNRTHWDGSAWSDGVPTAGKDAVIDAGAMLVVDTDLSVGALTVSPSATLRVNASLTATGSIVLEPNGTLVWNRPGSVGGNLVVLDGALLTHDGNVSKEDNKLDLTVAGNGLVSANGRISAKGKGYSSGKYPAGGPGASTFTNGYDSASHGGRGSGGNGPNSLCYGSILTPTNCGSCGFLASTHAGGGVVRLVFGGALTLDGSIDADAAVPGKDTTSYYTGSGGSVLVKAATLAGSGRISAQGGSGYGDTFGGGGRVAVYLTASASLAAFSGTMAAYPGERLEGSGQGNADIGPGTCYLETAADRPGGGVVTIANKHGRSSTSVRNITELPPSISDAPSETRFARVVARDNGTVYLTADTEVKGIVLEDSTAKLRLNGHTLRVRSLKPRNWADARVDPGEGGEILWNQKGFRILVR